MVTPGTDESPALSVICPAYNEEGAIRAVVEEVAAEVFRIVPRSELIVVDDGSRDRTGEILDGLAASLPGLRVIHQKNAGHGAAIRRGLDEARGERYFLIDSDRQIPLACFGEAWRTAAGADCVFGVRRNRSDPALRLVLTRVIRVFVRAAFGTRIRDLNAPFKVFTRESWDAAAGLVPPGTLAPSLFFAIIADAQGRRVEQIEVAHKERATGVVSIRRWRLLRFCARAFVQLLGLRWRLLWSRAGLAPRSVRAG
jgi:glycosyltransferase involved in cell wall biosynthesis